MRPFPLSDGSIDRITKEALSAIAGAYGLPADGLSARPRGASRCQRRRRCLPDELADYVGLRHQHHLIIHSPEDRIVSAVL
jgi:hypothetical protein